MLTRPEFIRGWLLLTAQPWGKAYRTDGTNPLNPEPSPAKIQAELYYKAVSFAYAPAWIEACELFAAGERWPSIHDLKEALRHTNAKQPGLTHDDTKHYLTKEQFGVTLYEAIRCCGALSGIQDQTNASVHHRKDMKELLAKKDPIKEELIGYMRALTADEVGELVHCYPFIARL